MSGYGPRDRGNAPSIRPDRDAWDAPGSAPRRRGPGLPGAVALIFLSVIALIGGIVDALTSDGLQLGFAVGLALGALLSAALVRRSDLLIVVFAPPLVYIAASALLVLASPGSGTGGLIDAATAGLVYGFPAMAVATGIAAVIAGLRAAGR